MKPIRLGELQDFSGREFRQVCVDTPQILAFVLNFPPGRSLRPHQHPGCGVTVQVLAGHPVVSVGTEECQLHAGDLLPVQGVAPLGITNPHSEPASVLVTLSPNPTHQRS